MPLEIRPFRPEDQAAARALILEGLAERWGWLDSSLNPDLEDLATWYQGQVLLVAHLAGELVGTGALTWERQGVGRIQRMSVARRWRRHGIASAILARLLDEARALGYRQIVLETTSTWEDAKGFYVKHGFRPLAECDGDTHFVKAL